MGKGIGAFCMNTIESIAKGLKCEYVVCGMYSKSEHAIRFYEKLGYKIYETLRTLKYEEFKMKKKI